MLHQEYQHDDQQRMDYEVTRRMAMPKFDDVFQSTSNYLKAADIPPGKRVKVTIERYSVKEFEGDKGKEKKVLLTFVGRDKALVCNKTNARIICNNVESTDLDDWVGAEISLYRARVDFQGQLVDALRVVEEAPAEEESDVPF